MARREIIDYLGNRTGDYLQRFVWRSQPTKGPLTGRPVRCIVMQDGEGKYWAGARIGPKEGQKCQYEISPQPLQFRENAFAESREMTREFLSHEAEVYAASAPSKGSGETIVRVEMDDGWSVSIREAEKPNVERPQTVSGPSSTTEQVFKALDPKGKDKKSPLERKMGRGWPSR